MVRLPRCIQLMARWSPLDHARPLASTALGPCCRDAAPARARGGLFRSLPHEREPRSPSQRRLCEFMSVSQPKSAVHACSPVNNRRKTTPTRSEIVASVKHAPRLRCLLFPVPLSRYPAASGVASERGRSSVVERQLPKLYVEGSIPFARSN